MINEDLIKAIKAGINPVENLNTLYLNNTGLIHKIALKYTGLAEYDDLFQEGSIGLINAVNNYDPEQGAFSTYARMWIQHNMQRYIENNNKIRLPSYLGQLINRYKRIQEKAIKKNGQELTDAEIMAAMGISENALNNIRLGLTVEHLASLETPLRDSDNDSTLADMIPGGEDPGESVPEQMREEELRVILWEMVDRLPADQSQAVRQHYKEGRPVKEIAKTISCSYYQAKAQIEKGVKELKRTRGRLRPYLPDRIYSEALHGGGLARFKHTWTSQTERVAFRIMGIHD